MSEITYQDREWEIGYCDRAIQQIKSASQRDYSDKKRAVKTIRYLIKRKDALISCGNLPYWGKV